MAASLIHRDRLDGRALYATEDGGLYRAEGFRVFESRNAGRNWHPLFDAPSPGRRHLLGRSRMATRLLRLEVRGLLPLAEQHFVVATRSGLFHGSGSDGVLSPARLDHAGDVAFPTTLATGPKGVVIWGEYSANKERRAMRLFASTDSGVSYTEVHRFTPGTIRHVHGLLHDPERSAYWVFVGDHGEEPGIGLLSEDFAHFEWVLKGQQRFRTMGAFDLGDHLVYGTDTEKEGNAIYRLCKESGRLTKLADTDGSCIHSCRVGEGFLLSTSAEPREDDSPQVASVWHSPDGESWERVYSRAKDRWQANLFQFGSLVLPRGHLPEGTVMFSGQAVEGDDGKLIIAEWKT